MQIVIAGGTGLIGQALVEHWLKQGHSISVVGRSDKKIHDLFADRVTAISWSKLTADSLKGIDVLVNLTGQSVGGKPWNDKRKQEILVSRTGSTKKLAGLLCELSESYPRWINASGIGIYGTQPQDPKQLPPALDDMSPVEWEHPHDFMAKVATRWEKATEPAAKQGVPVTILRFAAVLAKQGGALPLMMKPFEYYVGGPVGTGAQPFSWVLLDDVLRVFDFLLENPSITGPVNVVSPKAVTQAEFAKTLASVMQRPCFLKMPAVILKTLLGQMAEELVLEGQHAYPKRLQEAGFKFLYPDLESALNHILK